MAETRSRNVKRQHNHKFLPCLSVFGALIKIFLGTAEDTLLLCHMPNMSQLTALQALQSLSYCIKFVKD